MRGAPKLILSVCLLSASFLAGYWLRRPETAVPKNAARRPLYYHDPMHPAYKSDKPGIAPDCGMQLEPVYAEGSAPTGDVPAMSTAGAIRVPAERQQTMGLRTVKVSRASGSHTLRLLGRVAADETRVHRVSALAEGVVRAVSSYAAGDIVQKDDLLATYFVALRDVYNAIQNYFVAMGARDEGAESSEDTSLIDARKGQIRLAEELLRTYGLTEKQLRNLALTRQITRDIEFRSPVTGLILSRNVGLDQRLERGAELFRIAEINRVWILADVFEGDAGRIQAGSAARVRYRERSFRAVTSPARQFDPASRTFKVRLELDNPGLVLRPDMFVDVEFDVRDPDGLSVPTDALLDSGRRRAVFVAGADGAFEPREVTTGARYGDRVQILKGLEDGESVVVSGLFLLDSESRLQLAASGAPKQEPAVPAAQSDPVCGMKVDLNSIHQSQYQGETFRFCSKGCKEKFDHSPAGFVPRREQAGRS